MRSRLVDTIFFIVGNYEDFVFYDGRYIRTRLIWLEQRERRLRKEE